jgi:hypothetical protein
MEKIKIRRRKSDGKIWNNMPFDLFVEDMQVMKEVVEKLNMDNNFNCIDDIILLFKSGGEIDTSFYVYSLAEGKRCPRCHNYYVAASALSRKDNETEICPICGNLEALHDLNEAMRRGQ